MNLKHKRPFFVASCPHFYPVVKVLYFSFYLPLSVRDHSNPTEENAEAGDILGLVSYVSLRTKKL